MKKTDLAHVLAATGQYPMKAITTETLGVARSHLVERMQTKTLSACGQSQVDLSHHASEWFATNPAYRQATATVA